MDRELHVERQRGRTFGGGTYGGTLDHCSLIGNSAYWQGGGAYGSELDTCTLTGNAAPNGVGGGISSGMLEGCTLSSNSANDDGGGAYQSTLYNCTVSGNAAGFFGGGVCASTLVNCVLSSNLAGWGGAASTSVLDDCLINRNSAHFGGGGAYWSTLISCTLTNNSSDQYGGGAYSGTLNNCVLAGNLAGWGGAIAWGNLNNCTLTGNSATNSSGGCYAGTLNNCIVHGNMAPKQRNYSPVTGLNYCCTTPEPTNGFGNITTDPLFVDLADGNVRLQANSPCINAGNNACAAEGSDLDGNPRIAGGTVDIGAYEFQSPASLISYAWPQRYGLPSDGSADFADTDGDGMNNWQEWRCGTNPTNSQSALRMISALPTGTNVIVSWQSVAGINYFLESSTNLLGPGRCSRRWPPAFRAWTARLLTSTPMPLEPGPGSIEWG